MNFVREIRHAVPFGYQTPGFAVTGMVTLALGIGATTAIPANPGLGAGCGRWV